ncbi:hypothetical protein [Nonomuraea sp. NPDC049758]|uniref:hypothetical protein n=1 Tax=Nonomuraea sp. NPDC049758 TaxID=3154360 RepID=UPI003433F5C6
MRSRGEVGQPAAVRRQDLRRTVGHRTAPQLRPQPELHAEAARRPELRAPLAELTRADLALHLRAHEAAGLPATRRTAATVTMCLNTALTYLLTQPAQTLADYGLDDLDAFLRDLLHTVYPPRG